MAGNRPWQVVVSLGFTTEDAARRFECYLKSGSARAFAVSESIDFEQHILAWYDQRLKSEKAVTHSWPLPLCRRRRALALDRPFPSRVKKTRRSGAIIEPPSMNCGGSAVCTSPPQVRLPTSVPILR